MMLRGYREADRALLSGPWLAGELLGVPPADRPALAAPAVLPPPADRSTEVLVAPGAAAVRFSGVDWVHRRARLEIGLAAGAESAELVLKTALEHAFRVLDLHRVSGWATPAAGAPTALLAAAGLSREAVVPDAVWYAGRPVDREVWAVVRDA